MKQTKKQPEVRPSAAAGTSDLWIYAGIAAAVGAIYARAASFDFLNYGDPAAVAENPHAIGGFTGDGLAWAFTALRGGWVPLARLSHLLDCQLFGLNAGMHHAVNVLLHAAASLALFAVLKRATGARWPSAFAAFVFATHPLQVESVAWIAERGVLLAGLFSMLAILAHLRSEKWLTIAMFVCAVLSSPAAAALPVILILIDLWPLGKTAVGEKVPLFAISVVAMALAIAGKARFDLHTPVTAGMDLAKFVVPVRIALRDTSAVQAWEWSLAAAALALTVLAIRQLRTGVSMGWLWYIAALLPLTGSVYLSIAGLAIAAAWGSAALPGRVRAGIGMTACLAWAAVTWIEVGNWQNGTTVFQHSVEAGGGAFAYAQLGDAYLRDGHLAEAVGNFQNAEKLRPGDADVERGLGEALSVAGKDRAALAHLQRAVQLAPGSAKAHAALGTAELRVERTADAAAEYRKALAIDPDLMEAQLGLGEAGGAQEAAHLQAALNYYSTRVRLLPDDGRSHFELGRVYASMGRAADAVVEFSSAARLSPDDADAQTTLGAAMVAMKRLDEAFAYLSTAVRLRPEDPRALMRLGDLLLKLGRPLEAMTRMEQAMKLDPDLPGARDAYEAAHRRVYGN